MARGKVNVGKAVFVGGSALGVAGASALAAASGPDHGRLLGKPREFWTGVGAGILGAVALKAGFGSAVRGATLVGRRVAPELVRGIDARRVAAAERAALRPPVSSMVRKVGSLAAWTAAGTVPSYALLRATSDDRKVLGQGHDFWSGAVYGLAGVAVLKTVTSGRQAFVDHWPKASGWVLSDFTALGLDGAQRGGAH